MKPLSRELLLSRGRCCNNVCVNCPYKERVVDEPILTAIIPYDMTNNNDGQGHAWYRTAAARKAIEKQLRFMNYEREPFGFPVRLVVTRMLGARQKFWDADSVLRGSWKSLQDSLVAVGWFHDDSYKYIKAVDGRQDASQREKGAAVKVEVYKA